jgi:teichuronic acid biosynthesis glycosyltransferase TuaC
MNGRIRVLTISDIYPNPARPALGIFVERSVHHLRSYCDETVVVPFRVFPPARIFRSPLRPDRIVDGWRHWRREINSIPSEAKDEWIEVYYPRYTSPPRQVLHGLWGFFAYAFVRSTLLRLHNRVFFDLIHAHYASPAGVVALLAARRMKVPVVVSVHGADVTFTARQNAIGRRAVRWVLVTSDTVLANSSWTREQILGLGASPDRVQIVRMGADPPEGIVSAGHGADGEPLTLLTVGYLDERKGHRFVLEAMRALLEEGFRLRYVVVGDGPETSSLRRQAERLGLADKVSFEGTRPHAEVWRYFDECDIFVMPSWKEAFGVVYIEALSLGKPVVGCRGEGGPEDLHSLGDCVQLVEPRDVASLVDGLRELIRDPDRRRRMGATGRAIVRDRFSWAENAASTMAVYEHVLQGAQVRREGPRVVRP